MKELGKIVLHIPAREGSKRVPRKNMRLMNGKPMISYTIESSILADITKELYVNTDSDEIIRFVEKEYPDFKVYSRDKELANDKASSDQFNYDIIKQLAPDTLIMINPVCPLIDSNDIVQALAYFKNSDCDTLISSNSTQMQTFCNGIPVNINVDEQLAPSQENKNITILNWAITIWDARSFIERMKKQDFAVLGEKRDFYDLDSIKGVKVSEEKDFIFAEMILKNKDKI